MTINPRIAHDENDCPRPFRVLCNGAPFAGFDDAESAEKARRMWQDQPRPKHAGDYDFAVVRV